jgi:hypothetical protein
MSVTETLHNVPKLPRALRAAMASVTSAVALALEVRRRHLVCVGCAVRTAERQANCC